VGYPKEEVRAAVDAYVDLRRRIDAGEATWVDLAEMFTDDVAFIDPAWGRIDGIDELRTFLVESMDGLDDWSFPVSFTAIDGDHVVVKWTQVMPGAHPDGSPIVQSGASTLVYGGDGKFRYEEDLLNMVHVFEGIKASTWRPKSSYAPPPEPNRDFSMPGGS
jgi:limonene-1,2-epoxide hydrolase